MHDQIILNDEKQEGRFKREDAATIWAKYPASLHPWLLRLTEEFDLTYTLASDNVSIVPCLLPEQEPEVFHASTFCTATLILSSMNGLT